MKPGTRKSACPACGGRGQIRHQQGFFTIARTCSQCGGEGDVIASPCDECRGSGQSKTKKTLRVRVPGGVDEGTRLRMTGEGEAGPRGGGAGDLYVVIRVREHAVFERREHHLLCDVSISFVQAALGVTVEIPLLSGDVEKLKISPGTQSGEVFKIKGAGVRDLNGRRPGDLFVRVLVQTPGDLTKEQKILLRQLAEVRGETLETIGRDAVRRSRPERRQDGP